MNNVKSIIQEDKAESQVPIPISPPKIPDVVSLGSFQTNNGTW